MFVFLLSFIDYILFLGHLNICSFIDKKNTIRFKKTGIRLRWVWVDSQRGTGSKIKILGMGKDIIVLIHVHRNIVEIFKTYKLF